MSPEAAASLLYDGQSAAHGAGGYPTLRAADAAFVTRGMNLLELGKLVANFRRGDKMTTQITAVFDDRDGADLALMRLRRNGIEYSIAEMRAPDRKTKSDMPLVNMSPAYGHAATDGFMPGEVYAAVLNSRAVMERTRTAAGQARLTLNVRADQVLRAREIIATVKGRVL